MSDLEECSLMEILKDKDEGLRRHSAHCMIWAPWESFVIHGQFPTKAAILMQLRFDGSFGFAGGRVAYKAVNDHQEIVDGLNRELTEELNLNDQKFKVTIDDHLCSHRTPGGSDSYHFYALRVDLDDIVAIEKAALAAADYGDEVFGNVRVPLYTMTNGVAGLPTFLKNAFVGNAKDQLLKAIKMKKILTDDEIQTALSASQ